MNLERVIRFGVAGLGSMGLAHACTIADGSVRRGELAAVCSSDPAKCSQFPKAQKFSDPVEMIRSGAIDAIVIATPHLSHPEIGIASLNAGLHVMVEKPLAATKAQAERFIAAHHNPRQAFGAMFNMRTRPYLRKVREMIQAGELGEIRRVNWTATAFFRTQAYYSASKWRGTWAREGGGVLLNQAPHHLDLLQWFLGMPVSVQANCAFGKYHDIEVEDDVTAYLEFPNGATATFVTSTGEAPGSTRIEIAAERGRLIIENDEAVFARNAVPMTDFSHSESNPQGAPPVTITKIDAAARAGNYADMFSNFADAIIDGAPLIAPAAEGLKSLELANAMVLSSLKKRSVSFPLDAATYEAEFARLAVSQKP